MPFGQKYIKGNKYGHSMQDKGGGYDKAEAVKKVKDYNQVRNEVMQSKSQAMDNVSQVVGNLKKPLPKNKAMKK